MSLHTEEFNRTITININAWVVAIATVAIFVLGMWFESNTSFLYNVTTGNTLTAAELVAEPAMDADMVIDECTDGCTEEDEPQEEFNETESCGTSV